MSETAAFHWLCSENRHYAFGHITKGALRGDAYFETCASKMLCENHVLADARSSCASHYLFGSVQHPLC